MARGTKELVEQSKKKPKRAPVAKKKGEGYWWQFVTCNTDKNNSMFLSNDFLEAIKRMEPKEVADILSKMKTRNDASPRYSFFPPLVEPCFCAPAGFRNFR